jgi:hypothetical protein
MDAAEFGDWLGRIAAPMPPRQAWQTLPLCEALDCDDIEAAPPWAWISPCAMHGNATWTASVPRTA